MRMLFTINLNKESFMFLKYKTKKAVKKIVNGSSRKEIESALNKVVKEAANQISRRLDKFNSRMPIKVVVK